MAQEQVVQHYQLKKYLNENNIPHSLRSRVIGYLESASKVHRSAIKYEDVTLLELLSGPLQIQLHRQLFEPHIVVHPFFATYMSTSSSAMDQICYHAVKKVLLAKGDVHFHFGSEATEMCFVVQGALCYQRPRGIKSARRRVRVEKGRHFCEAALWVSWVHHGTMQAFMESDLMALDVEKFVNITLAHPEVHTLSKRYAHQFALELRKELDTYGYIWDLPSHFMHTQQSDPAALVPQGHEAQVCDAELFSIAMVMSSDSEEETYKHSL